MEITVRFCSALFLLCYRIVLRILCCGVTGSIFFIYQYVALNMADFSDCQFLIVTPHFSVTPAPLFITFS